MGAIARNAANNITTSGVFTSSAIANSSVTGITVLANASDGITFISSQTASNSASISFTGLSSTYKAYKFVVVNINPNNDNDELRFNFSTDNGSNYNVTKTTTFFRALHNENDSNALLGYQSSFHLSQGTGFAYLSEQIGLDNDQSSSGTLTLFNPSSTTYVKHFISDFNCSTDIDVSMRNLGAGYGNTTSAINAVRFQMDLGNFDGTIYLYGIK
ncbi:hypothetical protein [Flavobacterium sp.]|uniref:hypothetical protein n=1 Tax=Flavobacterium sp. TaxID=239 RepID=UPI003BEEC9F5